jgi:iron(III) transport system permease protein
MTPTSSLQGRGMKAAAFRPFRWLALAVAALVSLPMLGIVSSVLSPSTEILGHMAQTVLPRMLVNTVILCITVGAGTFLIGAATAFCVARFTFPGARAFEWLLLLPLAMPTYIIGYVYADALTYAGPVQSWLRDMTGWRRGDYWFPDIYTVWGAGVLLSLVLYPYVYLLARTAFLQEPRSLRDAAVMLGQPPATTWLTLSLPLARPALVAGVALALMETLADFATMQHLGVDTFTTAIYRAWIGMGDRMAALQLSTGLIATVLLLLLLERMLRGDRRYAAIAKGVCDAPPVRLKGWRAALAMTICAVPILLGFVAPVLLLLRLQAAGGDPLLGAAFLGYAWNSLRLAAVATAVIMAIAFAFAVLMRMGADGLERGLIRFAASGYALPGTVIAVGVLVPLAALDNTVDAAMRASFGLSTGLLLSGTAAALVFAYSVRFLAVGLGALEDGYARLSPNLDAAARTLGRSPGGVVRDVHVPLLRRAWLTGAVIVFVDVLKELPATLIVRPFDFDTLAVRVYQLASDERLAQASTGSLAIVILGLIPVILMVRTIRETSKTRG